jgi:major type 1 subunit fimbrin (pilin)
MKKSTFAVTLASLLISGVNVAHASDGTVNFIGELKDTTCNVIANNNITVDLGTPSIHSFDAVGSTSSSAQFNITLKQCSASTSHVRINFDGTMDPNNSTLLGLDLGGAEGVGIRIEEADGTQVSFNDTSTLVEHNVDPNTNEVSINYIAKYQKTLDTVTPGIANATSHFTVNYD